MNRKQRNTQKMAARRLLAEFAQNVIALERAIDMACESMTDKEFKSYLARKLQHIKWMEECIAFLRPVAKR